MCQVEVNVSQDDFGNFLVTAEEVKVKGFKLKRKEWASSGDMDSLLTHPSFVEKGVSGMGEEKHKKD